MIILIGGEKGGTGKTTITTNLASLRSKKNNNFILIDSDKQGSANSWNLTRSMNKNLSQILLVQKFGSNLPSVIKDLSQNYEDILIDAGGRDSVELRSAMVVADKIIVPVQTSQFDIWTIDTIDGLLEQAKVMNPNSKAFLLPNRVSTNPSVSELEEVRSIADEYNNLRLLDSTIYERIAYRKASKSGMSVDEINTDIKATNEMHQLYKEVFENE